MTNLERLKMEISDITYTDEQLTIFLLENNLVTEDEYDQPVTPIKRTFLKLL